MTLRSSPDRDVAEDSADEERADGERATATPEQRIAALLGRARAARAAKDLAAAHALYIEAAELGSTDADYALGVFALAGQVVARDARMGATHLRRAADAGHLQARVHLANVLDTGTVTGQPEPERAALFVRAAARSLGLAGTETAADKRALAEAGVGRFVAQVQDATYEETERWNKKARALGYGKRGPASEPELPPLAEQSDPAGVEPAQLSPAPSQRQLTEPPPKPKPKSKAKPGKPGPSAGEALAAAGFSLLFLVAGWGIAFAGVQAATTALELARPVPVFGARLDLIWPAAVGVVGVLPALLFYRASAFLRALGIALVAAFAGFMLHGTGKLVLLGARELQALALGSAVLWLALLVLGFVGGAKASSKRVEL